MMMNVTLSSDHRTVDGAMGSLFLKTLRNLVCLVSEGVRLEKILSLISFSLVFTLDCRTFAGPKASRINEQALFASATKPIFAG